MDTFKSSTMSCSSSDSLEIGIGGVQLPELSLQLVLEVTHQHKV